MFCGEKNADFDEHGLDLHYLRTCPMLKKCEHCKQVGFPFSLNHTMRDGHRAGR